MGRHCHLSSAAAVALKFLNHVRIDLDSREWMGSHADCRDKHASLRTSRRCAAMYLPLLSARTCTIPMDVGAGRCTCRAPGVYSLRGCPRCPELLVDRA